MSNQKATNSLLIILILAVLGFGGYYLSSQNSKTPTAPVAPTNNTDTTTPPPVTTNNVSDKPNTSNPPVVDNTQKPPVQSTWATYEDQVLGFAVEYPQDIFDAEPQGRAVDGGGVLLVAPEHSVPSDFSGQNPEKRQNLSIKFTVENISMKMAIAAKQLQNLESIPFNQANHKGKLFLLGAEGLNVQYGFLVINENRTMIVEFHYYDKSVFGSAKADDFNMEQQIEIFYSVLSNLDIQ